MVKTTLREVWANINLFVAFSLVGLVILRCFGWLALMPWLALYFLTDYGVRPAFLLLWHGRYALELDRNRAQGDRDQIGT